MFTTCFASLHLLGLWISSSSHTYAFRLHASQQLASIPEPTPEEFVQKFDTVDFAAQPYADQMLLEGRSPMTPDQMVWMSHYTDGLLKQAIADVEASFGNESTPNTKKQDTKKEGLIRKHSFRRDTALRLLHEAAPLEDAVLWTPMHWERDMIPKIEGAIDVLRGHDMPSAQQLRGVLEKLLESFWGEMHFPRSHFYLGMTDNTVYRYSKLAPQDVHVSLTQLRHMHTLDTQQARDKSDKRRDAAAAFIVKMYDQKLIGSTEWDLDDMLNKYGDASAKWALQSQTPLLSFRLEDGEIPLVPGPVYVMMEGNGRLGALNAAFDEMKAAHPELAPPKVKITVIPFNGPDLARKNFRYFLRLNWRNQFPDVDVEGWTSQVPDAVRKAPPEYVDVIRTRPRYFGYRPVSL